MNILGKRIKQLREEKGLNQVEFAKLISISNTTLSQYETGQRIPSDDIKIKIADYFNVSTDYLLGRTDKRNNTPEPKPFTNAKEAMQFILKQPAIMAFGGYDVTKMSDDEVIEFANELLHQFELISHKYKDRDKRRF